MDYLHCKYGSRQEFYRLDLVDRYGIKKKELDMSSGRISLDADIDIQKVGDFTFREDKDINYISDRVRPYMGVRIGRDIKWWSLGVFLLSKPINVDGLSSVRCYDESIILNESYILEPKLFLAGTNYIDVLSYLITSSGITKVSIEPTDLELPTDLVLDDTKTKLTWFNEIATQINYTRLSVDADGWFTSSKYKEPSPLNVEYIYRMDDTSVILDGWSDGTDYRHIPNVFKRVVSHPELGDLVSIYKNTDPTSKFSIQSQGREIVDKKVLDNVAGQVELDALTRRAAFNAAQVTKTINAQTLNMPHHTANNVLDIRTPSGGRIYVEHAWTMELKAGSTMTHKIKRLVSLD